MFSELRPGARYLIVHGSWALRLVPSVCLGEIDHGQAFLKGEANDKPECPEKNRHAI